jgi:hypothetical protein
MTLCRKCHEPISFQKKNGKWWPVHDFDRCKQIVRMRDGWKPKSVVITEGQHKEFYTGSIPPWDESLGDWSTDVSH